MTVPLDCCLAGEFVQEKSDEPYDQFKVTERAKTLVTALNLPVAEVRKRAIRAAQKRIDRGDHSLDFLRKHS
jgi:hypothetical protein